jgi:tRNA (guanine37-N1)-methyltransferase
MNATMNEAPLMRLDLVCAVPQTIEQLLSASIIGRARQSGVVDIYLHNLHDYATDRYRHIDDTPFGGGAGMIISCEPVFACIEKLQSERAYDDVIYMTPDGEQLRQPLVNRLSMHKNIIVLAGHYKGIDQRIRDLLVTREISIGDYVLTGGELPALVLVDAVVRLLPGAMSDAESALNDSFQTGLLDYPHYTRPADFRGHVVPEVLQGGNHAHIEQWREEQAYRKTQERRPDLLK